jgi:hypothetical protein
LEYIVPYPARQPSPAQIRTNYCAIHGKDRKAATHATDCRLPSAFGLAAMMVMMMVVMVAFRIRQWGCGKTHQYEQCNQ